MKKFIGWLVAASVSLGSFVIPTWAQSTTQDRRAVWISTVNNLDYPAKASQNNIAAQKKEYTDKLDALKALGMNTVVVQVRPKADALYESAINPWSDVLTGEQGKYPGYDPLAFMIEETHKRGMEFHAWMNPYRVTTTGTDVNTLSSSHPARLHPNWTLTYKNALYYNPALPEVKQHVVDSVSELALNYAVDAIHFDDYFYPSGYPLPEGEGRDGQEANQRRAHINDMVSRVSTAIKEINYTTGKKILFGISPIGIWKNQKSDSTGSNTGGNESYYSVCADSRTWIKEGWIDYIVPQIYWETGHKLADYETLVKWWSNEVKGTQVKLYIGQGVYKDEVATEIDKQLQVNEKYNEVKGSFYFSVRDLLGNRKGVKDKVATYHALKPLNNLGVESSSGNISTSTAVKTGVVTANSLNIRKGPGTHYALMAKVPKGTKVVILKTNNGWYEVKLPDGSTGFASSTYIKLEASNSQQSIDTSVSQKIATITGNHLNVRKGASTQFASLTKLQKGTQVILLEAGKEWCKIQLATGVVGYVSSSYINY
ncbi:hypothetical protein CS063_02070 [Sporanaerobium hydrogeniformans]|uniref:Uncharacterized protein n=1 Tax=Sporanaerobium hydrogeniformans TaxID=3072179 RepID=A0AC61DG92_9FIRM|nr:family 10 glycosylhydrolase [Sporanaerobium hydrogeniformans]PHV72284.1 hypothetical protein CS063_02070 [Sporanaerobium hydrogeniformans]